MPYLISKLTGDIIHLTIDVDEEKCIGCGKCKDVCPKGGYIWEVDDVAHVKSLEFCHACTLCVMKCPTDAIIFLRRPGDYEKYYGNKD